MSRCPPSVLRVLIAASMLGTTTLARGEPLPSPIDDFGEHALGAFGGTTWIYGAGAVASTAALSPSGGDHRVRVSVQDGIHAPAWAATADIGGYVLPLALAPGLYVAGLIAGDAGLAGAGSAATQALVVTVATTIVLKVGTGRPFPLHGGDPSAPDRLEHPEYAREFRPFGFDGRYAWPSGHTAAAFALAASLTSQSRRLVVPLIAYPVAAGIGGGMLVGDHHWASDVIAGALIGQALGWSIGAAFRETEPGEDAAAPRLHLVPLLSGVRGCAVRVTL